MVQEECAERIRLIDEYGVRAAELARLLQVLKLDTGDVRDSIIQHRARSRCDEAWRALQQHVGQHGCAPMISRTDR